MSDSAYQDDHSDELRSYEREGAINYLLSGILRSREAIELPSNEQCFDEDVNVYLAHLLYSVCLPSYSEWTNQYIAKHTIDVQELLDQCEDIFSKYLIYKLNADHLLLKMSVFKDNSIVSKNQQLFAQSDGYFMEKAKSYFEQAAIFNRRVYHKKTAVSDILQKIATHFEIYQHVLFEMRRDYFNFSTMFGDPSFMSFMAELKQYEHEMSREQKIDQFLDLFCRYKKYKDESTRIKLLVLGNEIKKIDNSFSFDLEEAAKQKIVVKRTRNEKTNL